MSAKARVLVVPLNWGLGHATRCIPLIKALLKQDVSVFLAGEGHAKALLQKEFPALQFLPLEGYGVRYARQKWLLPFTILTQVPKIIAAIRNENRWLQTIVQQYHIDAVISDNRYGLYHKTVPCVFITHQLCIKTGLGKMADRLLRQLNYRYINRFTACWVPDAAGSNNLGGELSHPAELPAIPVHYTGPLSRFTKTTAESNGPVLLLLSGPEPQRSLLENILLHQLQNYTDPVVLVRGLPGAKEEFKAAPNITVHQHLAAKELEQTMAKASFIIGRCGYSTVMDIAALQRKSILIPTPGQTEQEYLAGHLMRRNFALCIDQEKFHLQKALDLAATFNYHLPGVPDENKLNEVVTAFKGSLQLQQDKE